MFNKIIHGEGNNAACPSLQSCCFWLKSLGKAVGLCCVMADQFSGGCPQANATFVLPRDCQAQHQGSVSSLCCSRGIAGEKLSGYITHWLRKNWKSRSGEGPVGGLIASLPYCERLFSSSKISLRANYLAQRAEICKQNSH